MPEDTSSTTSESTPNPLAVVEEPPPKSALWIIVLLTALFALGVWDFGTGMEPNGCSMTFMYEFPTYVPVTLPVQVQTKFPNYALYAYGEGQSAEPLAEGKFSGIPVLFVPGNSGSFKQVRSLASVALRMALDEDARTDFHFDYFSVDFQEEFSAIYGGTLQAQSAFVAQSIQHILGLYRGQVHAPSSVVLVGHSIGGLVAQSLFVRPQFDKTTVRAIITLATPQDPVVTMDVYTREFYDEIHNYWNVSRATALRDVVFVSIGGGVRDMQVRSGLTHSKFADVNVATTHSPLVWVSTDHRCIAWCKQLVLALNRALFDGVDPARQQITRDAAKLRDVFQYHLLERSTGKRYQSETERFTPTIQFDTNGFWSDHMKRQFSFEREFVESNTQIVVMTFEDDPRHRFLAVDATGIDYNDWIFGCKDTRVLKNTRVCDVGHNLSKLSQVVPSNGKRKFAQLDMHELKKEFGYTHLVVHIPKGKKNVRVHLDVYNELHRHLEYLTPRWITFFKKYPIVSQTAERAVHYNITLLELDQSWQAYDITVRPLGLCSDQMHFGMMRFVTPWAQDVTQSLIAHNDTAQLTARLQMPKSPALIADNPGNPRLDILLNPNCRYSIEIQSAVHKMWGQIVRFYSPMVLPLMIAVLVVALTFQLKDLEKTGECSFLLSVLTSQVTPMSVVMPGRLLGYLVSTAAVAQFVPLTDFQRLTDQGLDFGVLPIILFFVAIGLVSLVSMAAWACVLALGNVANQAVIKFFGPLSPSEAVTELAVAGLTKVPFILSGILIALASATCGSVALCLGTFIHFVHLFKLYEEYLQARLKRALALTNAQEPSLSPVHFQFTLGLIWAFMSVLNFPALLAWSRNLPLQIQLQPDPSLIPAIALAGAMATTWGENAPRRLQFYQQLSVLVQFLAILLVLFGSVSMYRVNYFVSGVFVALALHQLLAPKKIFADVPEETPEADAITADVSPSKGNKKKNGLLVEKCASMLEPLVALQSFWINCERGILNSPLKAKRFVLQAIWRQMRLNRDVEIDSSEANGALEQRRRSSLHPVPFSPQIIQVGSSSNWEELSLHREVTSAKAPRQALLSRIRQLCGTVFKSPQTSSSTGEPLHDLPETSHGFQSLMALPKTFPQELFHLLKDAGFFLSYYAQTLLGGFRSQIDLNEVKAAPKKILRDLVKLAVDVPGFFWTTGALLLSPLKELQTVPSKFAHDLITLGTEAGSFLGHFVLLALRVVQKRQTTNARQVSEAPTSSAMEGSESQTEASMEGSECGVNRTKGEATSPTTPNLETSESTHYSLLEVSASGANADLGVPKSNRLFRSPHINVKTIALMPIVFGYDLKNLAVHVKDFILYYLRLLKLKWEQDNPQGMAPAWQILKNIGIGTLTFAGFSLQVLFKLLKPGERAPVRPRLPRTTMTSESKPELPPKTSLLKSFQEQTEKHFGKVRLPQDLGKLRVPIQRESLIRSNSAELLLQDDLETEDTLERERTTDPSKGGKNKSVKLMSLTEQESMRKSMEEKIKQAPNDVDPDMVIKLHPILDEQERVQMDTEKYFEHQDYREEDNEGEYPTETEDAMEDQSDEALDTTAIEAAEDFQDSGDEEFEREELQGFKSDSESDESSSEESEEAWNRDLGSDEQYRDQDVEQEKSYHGNQEHWPVEAIHSESSDWNQKNEDHDQMGQYESGNLGPEPNEEEMDSIEGSMENLPQSSSREQAMEHWNKRQPSRLIHEYTDSEDEESEMDSESDSSEEESNILSQSESHWNQMEQHIWNSDMNDWQRAKEVSRNLRDLDWNHAELSRPKSPRLDSDSSDESNESDLASDYIGMKSSPMTDEYEETKDVPFSGHSKWVSEFKSTPKRANQGLEKPPTKPQRQKTSHPMQVQMGVQVEEESHQDQLDPFELEIPSQERTSIFQTELVGISLPQTKMAPLDVDHWPATWVEPTRCVREEAPNSNSLKVIKDIPQEDEDWFQEDKTPQRPKKRPPKAKQEELEQTEQTEQTEMSRIDWGEEISEQELQLFEMLKAERHQFPEDARFISDTSEKAIVPDKIKCDNQGYDPASNPDKDPPKRPKKRLRSEKSGESPIVKVSLDLGDELSLAELKLLKTLESGNESDDVDAHQWTANTPMSQNGSKTPREHIQEDDPSMEPAPLEVPPQRPKKKPASKKTDLVNPPKTEVDFGDMKMSAEDLKILDFSKLTEKKVGKLKLPEGIEDEANIHASSLVPRKVVGQDWELKQMELDVQGEQDALRVSKVKHEDARIIPQSRMASKDTNLKNRPAHEVTSSDELKDSQSWSSSLKKKIDEDQGDYEEELLQDNDLAVRIEAPRSNDSEGYSAVEVEEDHSERPREEPSQRMKERHLDPEIELVDVNMAHTQELVQDEWEIDEDMPTLERIDPISVPVIEHKYLLEVLRSKDFELSDEQFEAIYGDEDPTMDHPPASIEVEDSPEVDYQFEEEESEYESDDILEFENIPEVILEDERDEGGLDECQVPLNRFQIDDLDLMSLKFTPEELQKMLQGPLVDNSKDIGTLDRRALKKFASPVDEFRLNRKFVEKSRQDRDQENVRLEDNQSLEELQPLELMSNPNSGEDLELGQALQSPIEPELIPGEEAPQELSRTRSIPDQNQSDESPRGYEKRWFDGCLDNEKRSMGKETPLPPVEDFTEANYQPTMGPVSYEDPTLGIQGTNNEDSDNDLNFLPISRLSHPSIEHLETEAALEADVEVEAEGRQVRAYEDHAMEIQGTPNEDSENDLNFLPISRPSHPSIEHLETEAALEADVEDEAEDRLVRVNKATKKRSKGKFLPTPGSDDDIERDSKDGKPTKERSPRLRRKRVTPILDLALDPNDSVEPRDSAESHPPSSDAEASKASRLYISHFVPLEQGYVPKKLKDPKPGSSNRNSTISTASEGRLSASYDTDKWDGTQPGDKPQPIGPPTELNLGGPLIELVPRGPPIEAVASVSPIDLEASGPCNDPAPLSSGGASEADDVFEDIDDIPSKDRVLVPRDHSWESIGAKPKGASGSIQTSEAEFSDLGEDDEDAMDLRSRLSNYRGPMSSGASSRRASFGTPSNLEDGGHAHPLFGSRPGPIRSQSGTSQEGAYLYGHPDDERSSSQLSIYNTDSTLDISIPLDPETRSLLLAQGVHMGEPMEAFAKKVQEAREQLEKELLGLERATPEPASVQPRQRSVSEQRVRSASSLGFSRKTSEYSSPWSKMAKASPAEDEAEIQSSTGRRSRFDFDPRSYGAYLSRSYSTRRSLRERRRDYSWENPDLSIHLSRSRSTDIVGPSPLIPETKEYRARKDMIKSLDDEIVARRKVTRALKTQALMQSVNSRINATHDPPPPVLKFSYGNRPSRYLDSNPPTSGHFSDNTPGNLRKSYDDLANVTLARYMKDRSYTTRLGRRYSFK